MFNDTENGQTQHCPMCLEWAEKCEKLKENLKCKHLVLDECSLTGGNCRGIKVCFEELEEKLNWVRECISNYLSIETLDNMSSEYYREWMLNVRNKVISKINEPNDSISDRIAKPGAAVEISDYHSRDN